MYYELYIDSLFLTDFVMNFFLLKLTGKILRRSVTRFRYALGAAYGAVIYCTVFIVSIFSWYIRLLIGAIISLIGMILFVFKCKSIRQIWDVVRSMAIVMLIMGGIFFVFTQKFTFITNVLGELPGTVAVGVIGYTICNISITKMRKLPQPMCEVELITDMGSVKVNGLIDTGNLLIEPISQKPVSVLDENSLKILFGGQLPEYYRVVPYTSIGRKSGLMKCFEIPRVLIDIYDEHRTYEKVFVACGEELAPGDRCMIINPRVFDREE